VFGWEIVGHEMGPSGTYWVVTGGENGGWAGMMSMPADMPDLVPNHWMTYFATDHIGETLAKIASHGGQTVSEPFDVPGVGTLAIAHDAAGGNFSLMQPASGA